MCRSRPGPTGRLPASSRSRPAMRQVRWRAAQEHRSERAVEASAAPPSTPAVPASIVRRETECRRTVLREPPFGLR